MTLLDRNVALTMVEALAQTLQARDPYTALHGLRVEALSCEMACALRVSVQDFENLRFGAKLHDIGKIGLPDSILLKPGPLTDEERALMRTHTRIGRNILEPALGLDHLLPIVELHHENFDGSGYPYGLSGADIPLPSRIVRVADAYDALISSRVYRPAHAESAAMEFIAAHSGTDFDPQVVAALHEVLQGKSARPREVAPEVYGVWAPG